MLVPNQVSLRRGAKLVLECAGVTLQPGGKVGLVGRNRAGESSLLPLPSGRPHAEAGDLQMPPRWQPGGMAEVA
jgi:ATP-binding cassette subfamily F protein 3